MKNLRFLIIFCILTSGSIQLYSASLKAKVIKVSGKVHYRPNKKKRWTKLKEKKELGKNSYVRTGEKSTAVLEIGKKGLITIHELSTIQIASLKKKESSLGINIRLLFGKIWNKFKKKDSEDKSNMTIQTPAAVASVRGTAFYVESEKKTKNSKIGVWSGEVEVQARKNKKEKKMVPAAHEILVLYNKPLQDPIKMKEEEIKREKEFNETIKNLGLATAYAPATEGMAKINDQQINKARNTLDKARLQIKGEEIVRKDFETLKQALLKLYADTGYNPGQELSGKEVKKGARNSLQCLLKKKDRTGKRIKKWKGPYIDSDLKDPFDNVYGIYLGKTPRGTPFVSFYSLGIDKVISKDDIESSPLPISRLQRQAAELKKK